MSDTDAAAPLPFRTGGAVLSAVPESPAAGEAVPWCAVPAPIPLRDFPAVPVLRIVPVFFSAAVPVPADSAEAPVSCAPAPAADSYKIPAAVRPAGTWAWYRRAVCIPPAFLASALSPPPSGEVPVLQRCMHLPLVPVLLHFLPAGAASGYVPFHARFPAKGCRWFSDVSVFPPSAIAAVLLPFLPTVAASGTTPLPPQRRPVPAAADTVLLPLHQGEQSGAGHSRFPVPRSVPPGLHHQSWTSKAPALIYKRRSGTAGAECPLFP